MPSLLSINNFGLLPEDITYGLEYEFLTRPAKTGMLPMEMEFFNLAVGKEFKYSGETDSMYMNRLSASPMNHIERLSISEISSPPLHDTPRSLATLDFLSDRVLKESSVNVPNPHRRNIHIHFDKKVLGNKMEYLRPLLMVMRAYENIIYRIACSETGIPPKQGLSLRIGEALKEKDNNRLLKTYNGNGKMDGLNWVAARAYGLNLFNLRCYSLGKLPKIVFKRPDDSTADKNLTEDQILQNTRLELNAKKLGSRDVAIMDIPPTIEFRLTPFTCNNETIRQYLLLFNTVLGMARSLGSNKELAERVEARNKKIDEEGPEVFNIESDPEGINDLVSWLPADKALFRDTLLEVYDSSKPLLNLEQVPIEPEIQEER